VSLRLAFLTRRLLPDIVQDRERLIEISGLRIAEFVVRYFRRGGYHTLTIDRTNKPTNCGIRVREGGMARVPFSCPDFSYHDNQRQRALRVPFEMSARKGLSTPLGMSVWVCGSLSKCGLWLFFRLFSLLVNSHAKHTEHCLTGLGNESLL